MQMGVWKWVHFSADRLVKCTWEGETIKLVFRIGFWKKKNTSICQASWYKTHIFWRWSDLKYFCKWNGITFQVQLDFTHWLRHLHHWRLDNETSMSAHNMSDKLTVLTGWLIEKVIYMLRWAEWAASFPPCGSCSPLFRHSRESLRSRVCKLAVKTTHQ